MVALDDLDRVVRVGLLFDHYGPLLTEHQREAVDLYYLRNWSLQEIAESWATSRQAVHDLIGRAVRQMEEYDDKLDLLARDRAQRAELERIAGLLAEAGTADDMRAARRSLTEAAAGVRNLLAADADAGQ